MNHIHLHYSQQRNVINRGVFLVREKNSLFLLIKYNKIKIILKHFISTLHVTFLNFLILWL